jgi:hypothetical protein
MLQGELGPCHQASAPQLTPKVRVADSGEATLMQEEPHIPTLTQPGSFPPATLPLRTMANCQQGGPLSTGRLSGSPHPKALHRREGWPQVLPSTWAQVEAGHGGALYNPSTWEIETGES